VSLAVVVGAHQVILFGVRFLVVVSEHDFTACGKSH
jgi:hypothetical protein